FAPAPSRLSSAAASTRIRRPPRRTNERAGFGEDRVRSSVGRGRRRWAGFLIALLVLRDAAPVAFAAEGSILPSSPASEGRSLYREGEYDLAADALEKARARAPDDE